MALIRTEIEDDIISIHAIHCEAFGRATEGNLVNTLRNTNYFSQDLSLVASVDNQLVGHLLFTRVVIKEGKRTYPALALMPLAVIPSFQNKGIAKELLSEGLRRAKYAGHKAVIVQGDLNFYKDFGFMPASSYDITPPPGISEENFLIAQLTSETLPMKGQVYYPIEFDILSLPI